MVRKPLPTGEYAVGTTTFTVYNDRDEILFPGTKRSIPARVYYPSSKDSVKNMKKARYMSENVAGALKKYMHVPVDIDKSDAKGDNCSECYDDAPVTAGMKFPLIMFSHGLSSYRESNSFLCIELASHGYVVISVAHPYDAACAELDDGTTTEFYKQAVWKQYEPFIPGAISAIRLMKAKGTNRELAERFDDIRRKYCEYLDTRVEEWMKDTLAVVRYAKENLGDMIDTGCGIGVTGHSLGGATAYMLCLECDDFTCGVNLDGALFGNNKGKILGKPFVQISCKTNLSAETRPFIDHSETVYGALFKKMKHLGFSDMKHMIPVKALVGGMDADVMHESMCRLHLELFDTYLKKTKDHPEFTDLSQVAVTAYQPDTEK